LLKKQDFVVVPAKQNHIKMINTLFKFLDTNPVKIFWGYIVFVLLMVVLPLNGFSSHALNNVYIVEIRLDHLLHGILFLPWFFISVRLRQLPVFYAVAAGITLAEDLGIPSFAQKLVILSPVSFCLRISSRIFVSLIIRQGLGLKIISRSH
jgi:hypothetical protein